MGPIKCGIGIGGHPASTHHAERPIRSTPDRNTAIFFGRQLANKWQGNPIADFERKYTFAGDVNAQIQSIKNVFIMVMSKNLNMVFAL